MQIEHLFTPSNGELPQYSPEWEFMGRESLYLYKKMLRKVNLLEKLEITEEEHNILKNSSYSTLFLTNDWRKFISDQYVIIAQKYQEIENNTNCEHKLRNPFLNLYRKLKNITLWKKPTR